MCEGDDRKSRNRRALGSRRRTEVENQNEYPSTDVRVEDILLAHLIGLLEMDGAAK